jgi:hypothetical protein
MAGTGAGDSWVALIAEASAAARGLRAQLATSDEAVRHALATDLAAAEARLARLYRARQAARSRAARAQARERRAWRESTDRH